MSKNNLKRPFSTSSAQQNANKKRHVESWHRKTAPSLDLENDALLFQQTSIEWQMDQDQKPVIHIYGITEEGNSVLCHVHGFLPYAFLAVPEGFNEDDLPQFEEHLARHLEEDRSVVVKCEIVQRCSIYGYNEEKTFVRVTLTNPYKLSKLGDAVKGYQIFESNLDFVLRFMVDKKIVGMNWIELPAESYKVLPQCLSRCQLEVDISYDRIISHPPEGSYSTIAPLRTLSFDIECTGLDHNTHHVIQIANVISVHGEREPCAKVIFTLGGCSAIEGAIVKTFKDEKSMLMAWRDFVNETDPDMFTGYNINGFDFPFLIDRAALVGLKGFPYFGRDDKQCHVRTKETTTKAYGTRKTKVVDIPGRTSLDMCEIIRRDYKLPSYKLNSVSEHFLQGDKKIDLPYREMFKLQDGSNDDRRRIAEYCLKDAELPLLLMSKLMCLPNYVEMARVTGVPLSFLLTRGQQIKVLSQIYRRANAEGYVIPVVEVSEDNDNGYEGATVIEPDKGFYDIPIATLDFNSLYPSIMMAHNLCYTTHLSKSTIKSQRLVQDKDYFVTPSGDAFLHPSKRQGLLPQVLQDLIAARKKAKADLKKEMDPFKRAVLDGRQLALKIVANSVYGFTGAQKGYLPCPQIASSVTAFGREMINETRRLVEARYTKMNGYDHDAKVIYGDTDSVMIKFGYTDLAKVMELSKEAAEHVTAHFKCPINLEFEKAYFPYLLVGKKRYAGLYWTNPLGYDKVDIKGIDIVRRDRCGLVQDAMKRCLDAILVNRNIEKATEIVRRALSDLLRGKVDLDLLMFTGGWGKSKYTTDPPHVTVAKKTMRRDPNVAIGPGDRIAYVIVAGVKGSKVNERAEDPAYARANNLPIDVEYYLSQLKRPLIDIFGPILGNSGKTEDERREEIEKELKWMAKKQLSEKDEKRLREEVKKELREKEEKESRKRTERELFTGPHMNRVVKQTPILPSAFKGFTVVRRCKQCKIPLKDGVCNNC